MIEGLWTGEWKSNIASVKNHAAGTFTLDGGNICGGDTTYYYLGTYRIKGNKIYGEMEFTHFGGDPLSILGLFSNGHLSFKGKFSENEIKIVMDMKETAMVRMDGVLVKRMNLDEKTDASYDLLSGGLPKK